jgi:hypothetical protein
MTDEADDESDILYRLAYVRADSTQHDTIILLTMIDAAIAEIMNLRTQLRWAQDRKDSDRNR